MYFEVSTKLEVGSTAQATHLGASFSIEYGSTMQTSLIEASIGLESIPQMQTVQMQLNAIRSKTNENWPHLSITGRLDEQTREAIVAFQRQFDISHFSDYINEMTFSHISEVYRQVSTYLPLPFSFYPMGLSLIPDRYRREVYQIAELIVGYLSSVSSEVERQMKLLKTRKIGASDVEMLVRNMFEKPNLKKIRKNIEHMFLEDLKKEGKAGQHTLDMMKARPGLAKSKFFWGTSMRLKQVQQQISTGILNGQSRKVVEEKLAMSLMDKLLKELKGINFERKIATVLKGNGFSAYKHLPLLQVVTVVPVARDFLALCVALINGKPTDELQEKLVATIVSFVESYLIGWLAMGFVAVTGMAGWGAVVVVLVIVIILGLLLQFFFPDHAEKLASKINDNIKFLINEIKLLQLS